MTVVNPKSISGITSITTASGSDDLLTIHTNNGTERLRVDSTGATKIVTGIVTTLTATTGIVTTLTTNTLTANSTTKVGSGVTLSPDGDIFITGVSTIGTLSVSGIATVGGVIDSSTGTVTSSGNMTVGDSLTVTRNVNIGTAGKLTISGNAAAKSIEYGDGTTVGYFISNTNVNRASADSAIHLQQFRWNNTKVAEIKVLTGDDTTNKDNAHITFETASAGTTGERMRINDLGQVGINTAIPTCQLEILNSKTKTWTPTSQTELLVERAGNCIVSIVGNNNANCVLNFSDSDDENPGNIDYDHADDTMTFRCGAIQRAKILSDGRLVLGSPTVQTTVDYSLVAAGRIQSDGTYDTTTGSSANVHIGTTGLLRRSTSSARYKKDITDATWGLADVLKLKPKTFKSNATGEDADDKTYAGFIAEDVHDIGLTNFVEYNSDNQPDAIHYGNMVALMAKAIQEQQEKIETLEAEVAALKSS